MLQSYAIQLNQTVNYDKNNIINSFTSGIINNPSDCNTNYWIPLFYQSNLTGAATGQPDPNVMAVWFSVYEDINNTPLNK